MSSQCRQFELYLLRDADVAQMRREGVVGLNAKGDARDLLKADSPKQAMAIAGHLADWIEQQCVDAETVLNQKILLSSVATFLPGISSVASDIAQSLQWPTRSDRDTDLSCLLTSVLTTLKLAHSGRLLHPIVEIVCGYRYELLHDADDIPFAFEIEDDKKLSITTESIRTLVSQVQSVTSTDEDLTGNPWYLAFEIEPGDSYYLNEWSVFENVIETMAADPNIGGHIGANIDLAHLNIVGATPTDVAKLARHVLNAHVCDLPGMHTRDQPVGAWHQVDNIADGLYGFLDVLDRIYSAPNREKPCTGSVSLELEGCGNSRWIRESLSMLDSCIMRLNNQSKIVREYHPLVPIE